MVTRNTAILTVWTALGAAVPALLGVATGPGGEAVAGATRPLLNLQAVLELLQSIKPENTVYVHHEDAIRWRGDDAQRPAFAGPIAVDWPMPCSAGPTA